MANCEKCGNSFTPSAERTEVTSLRILCPKCESERRAEKAARAKAAAAAQAGHRPAATAAQRPAAPAAQRPAAPAAQRPATPAAQRPAARPAAQATPATGSPERPSTRPSASRAAAGTAGRRAANVKPVATGVRGAQARKLHGEASKKLFHKPVEGAEQDQRGADFHPDVQRELRILKQRENKVMTIAWVVCGVLVLAAGGFGLAAKMKRDADREAVERYQQALADFQTKMESFDVNTENGAREAIAFADAEDELNWENDLQVGSAVTGVLSRARSFLDRKEDEKEQTQRLQSVESTLSDVGSKTADDLAKARRTLESLEGKGDAFGEEFAARVKTARIKVDRAFLSRLYDEAKALSERAGEGNDRMRAALNAWTRAENEATAMLDKVVRTKDEEAKQYFTGEFQKIVTESSAFVTTVFTENVIEQMPWTDLLNEGQKKNWQNYGLEGFRLENGVLEISGPAAGSTANGLVAVPAAGGYRDFVIDMEFTLEKGTVDFLFRLGRRVDNTVENYTVSTTGQEPLKPGVAYHIEATFIGSQLKVLLSPPDARDLDLESTWIRSRKGAFGAQIHEGTQMKITRLRIRELRNA